MKHTTDAGSDTHGSERLFSDTFDKAAVGIAHVAPDGQWLRVNDKLCDIVGYTRSELLELSFQDITFEPDLDVDLAQVKRVLSGEITTYTLQKRYVRKDRQLVWINLSVSLVRRDDGNPDYFISVVEDIGERVAITHTEAIDEHQLRALYRAMAEGVALHEMVRDSSDTATDYRILAVNPAYTAILGLSAESVTGKLASEIYGEQPPPYMDIYREVVETGRSVRFETDYAAMGISFEISVFTPGPYQFATVFSDISERKRGELERRDALRRLESERGFLKSLIHTLPDLIWLKDTQGVYLACNPAFERFIGATEAEIVGHTDHQLVSPELARAFIEHDDLAKRAGQALIHEEEITFADDGHRAVLETTKTPMLDKEGNLLGVLGIGHDISHRKLAEAKLQESSERFQALLSTSKDGFWTVDMEGKVIDVNETYLEMSGYRREEVLQHFVWEFDTDLKPEGTQRRIAEMQQAGNALFQTKHLRKDGSSWPVEIAISYSPLQGGKFYGFLRDITQRERAAAELRRFATVFRHAAWGMVIADSQTGLISHVNPAYAAMHGFGEMELIGKPVADTYAPEVRTDLQEFINRANKEGHLEFETLHLRKDGSTFPCRVAVTVYRDTEGFPLFRAANVEDLTASHRAALALRESAERYRAVVSTVSDGYWIADLEGRLLEVNDACCRMSGYTRAELLSMRVFDLEVVEAESDTRDHIQRIRAYGNDVFESVHRRKDGEHIAVEVAVSYADIQGGRMFCFVRDIEDRKRNNAMAELREQLAELLPSAEQDGLLRMALDTAEKITGSQIGFFHFVEPDQETVSLQVWSTRTTTEMCFAKGDGLHYPISEAGVWVDCIHARRAVIHNDYSTLPNRKGLPKGHAAIKRELTVPLMRDNRIVAVIGVGNKASAYTDRDVAIVKEIADIGFDYFARKRAERQIQFMAYYDVLTELPNRVLLSDRLLQAMAQARRARHLIGVCYLDLDGFKPINDRYGHHIGDKLLVKVAKELRGLLRDGDTLARMGGDEFVVILTALMSPYECEDVAERLLAAIQKPIEVEAHRIHLSASIGITLFPTDDADADTLLRHADQAMYKAKAAGKSVYHFYDPVDDQNRLAHRQLLSDFDAAIHAQQLALYYQPQIDLHSGAVVGVEALIRWNHPEKGLLLPGDFLPAIEDTPQELALGEWVVRSALDQHLTWQNNGIDLAVSVNISPRQIQMKEFAEFVTQLVGRYPQGTANQLEIEMLEIAAINNLENAISVMRACAAVGVRFALDDFGTGYSSLTYFHRLPIDVVKIDQHFVREMLTDASDLDIVEGVLRLAAALNRPVVAEGVESIEIAMMLVALGCSYAQGYGIARPMPAENFASWLIQWNEKGSWGRLLAEVHDGGVNYDIDVMVFSHKMWLERIERYVRNEPGAALPPLGDKECQLGRWYNGIGRNRHGNHSGFAFIPKSHHAVHELAQRIVSDAIAGKREQAIACLGDLQARGDELTAILHGLNEQE